MVKYNDCKHDFKYDVFKRNDSNEKAICNKCNIIVPIKEAREYETIEFMFSDL